MTVGIATRVARLTDPGLEVAERVASHRVSFACLVATCALLPAYTVRWHLGPLPTTLLENAILVTLAAFALESRLARQVPPWRSPLVPPAVLFVLVGAVAVGVSPDHRAALGLYRAYILEPIALFVVAAAVLKTELRARAVILGLWAGGLVVAGAQIWVVAEALRRHALNVAVAPPVVIYGTANATALFLVPLVALAGALALYGRGRLRLAAAGFGLAASAGILASFSRGGYLALAIVGLVLALTHARRAWLVPALLVGGAALTRIPPVARRLAHEVDLSDPNNSFIERTRLWAATLRMLRDHPVLGTGLSGFRQSIEPYRQGTFTEDLIYPHNIVLNFWTETGLAGVAVFAWILVQGFRLSLGGWRRGVGAWRPYHLGVALALLSMLIHGLVDVPYWKNDLSAEFWLLLALTWAGTRWAQPQADTIAKTGGVR